MITSTTTAQGFEAFASQERCRLPGSSPIAKRG
jgi:hypothetical protein